MIKYGKTYSIKCTTQQEMNDVCNILNKIPWTYQSGTIEGFHNGFNFIRIESDGVYTNVCGGYTTKVPDECKFMASSFIKNNSIRINSQEANKLAMEFLSGCINELYTMIINEANEGNFTLKVYDRSKMSEQLKEILESDGYKVTYMHELGMYKIDWTLK